MVVDVKRFCRQIKTDEVFGTHQLPDFAAGSRKYRLDGQEILHLLRLEDAAMFAKVYPALDDLAQQH